MALRQPGKLDRRLRVTPVVFIVDDDVSVHESLEALIRFAGWQVEVFATAQEFLSRRRRVAANGPPHRPNPCERLDTVAAPELFFADGQHPIQRA